MKKKLLFMLLAYSLVITSACNKRKDQSQQMGMGEGASQLSIPVGKGPDALFLTPDHKKLYVANVEDTLVSIISTESNKSAGTISPIRYPWGFALIGASTEVAVSAYDKQLAVVNYNTDRVVREKTYSSHLGGITADSTGKYLYVVAIDIKKVMKIDAATLNSLDSYETGNAPDGIGISKDNQKLYVTNTEDETISVINIADKTASVIATGGKPELVHPSHNGSLLYISNFDSQKIHVIDTKKDVIIHEITGLEGPEEAIPNHAGNRLYVVNFNNERVYMYETPGYKKLPEEYATGHKPIGVVPVRNKLYVSNYGDNSVSVISLDE